MTCRDLAEFIADYLSGDISGDVRSAFEHHLSRCPNCRNYLSRYRASIELGRRAFEATDDEVPAEVPQDLVKAILASRVPPRSTRQTASKGRRKR